VFAPTLDTGTGHHRSAYHALHARRDPWRSLRSGFSAFLEEKPHRDPITKPSATTVAAPVSRTQALSFAETAHLSSS
jgi:hypothetical protein